MQFFSFQCPPLLKLVLLRSMPCWKQFRRSLPTLWFSRRSLGTCEGEQWVTMLNAYPGGSKRWPGKRYKCVLLHFIQWAQPKHGVQLCSYWCSDLNFCETSLNTLNFDWYLDSKCRNTSVSGGSSSRSHYPPGFVFTGHLEKLLE